MTTKNGCDYEMVLDDEELEGMAWLHRTLKAIRDKGTEHKSFGNAAALARALNKIRRHCNEMHDVAHVLEHRNNCLLTEAARFKMQIQPWGEA